MIEDPRYPALLSAVRNAKSQDELSAALAEAIETFLGDVTIIGETGTAFYTNMLAIAHSKARDDIKAIERAKA